MKLIPWQDIRAWPHREKIEINWIGEEIEVRAPVLMSCDSSIDTFKVTVMFRKNEFYGITIDPFRDDEMRLLPPRWISDDGKFYWTREEIEEDAIRSTK